VTSDRPPDSAAPALLRILRGNPDEAEVAALVTALSAVLRRTADPTQPAHRTRFPTWTHELGYCPPGSWRAAPGR
jgi:hypothetical protein